MGRDYKDPGINEVMVTGNLTRDPELVRRELRQITKLIDELALQASSALTEDLEHVTAALLGGELANLFGIRIDPTSDRRKKTNSRPGR